MTTPRLTRPWLRRGSLLLGALLLTACGTTTGGEPGQPPLGEPVTATEGVAGFPSCADVPQIRADDAAYRDEPVYGNAEQLTEEVRVWAASQPGFVEIGLDRERNGWITIWVKDADLEGLTEQIAQRWPEEGIVVVEVPWSNQELTALHTEVDTALRGAGVQAGASAVLAHHGVASIYLGVLTPEAETVLAEFDGRPLCVDAIPAEEAPEEKAQPTEGPGWRLLGEDLSGEAYRTSVATTPEQLEEVWRTAGLAGAPPSVDWDTEVAVWFGAVYGSGCPVRLDGIVVASDLLHADLVVPGAIHGCNADANPHAFVLAVERDVLPAGPFQVQLSSDDPPGGAPEERTIVDVDLTAAGSTATSEQVHPDAELAMPREVPLVADGDDLPDDTAVRYIYRDDPDCETPVLGPLDGSHWRLADREAPWDVEDGDELALHPLGGSSRELIASAPQMDWMFARLPEGTSCP